MFSGAVHSQSRARVRSQTAHRQVPLTSSVIGSADIQGCMFPRNLKHRKSSETLFSTRLCRACRVTTRWRSAPAFHDCLMKVKKPHSPLEKAQVCSGPGPFGCPEPFCLLYGLGRPQQQEGDARWSMSYAGPKSGTAISLWERRLPPPGRSPWEVWIRSFPSVDLKVAVSWRKKRKKGNVDERVAAGWLVQVFL